MRIAFFLLIVNLLCAEKANSQSNRTQDIIYLKNQWVIRGRITDSTSLTVGIQTQDGNIFTFRRDEIDRITKEKKLPRYLDKQKGFADFTELGPLIAGKTSINGVTTAAFSFQTVNGYQFSPYVMAGMGIGADLYATQTLIPIFASFRGELSKSGQVIPYYFLDGGYGINITQNSENGTEFKGGILYAAGFGLKIPFNQRAGFMISFGYRFQKTSYIYNQETNYINYNRIVIRAGFFL